MFIIFRLNSIKKKKLHWETKILNLSFNYNPINQFTC